MRLSTRLWGIAAAICVALAVQASTASASISVAPVPAYTKTSGNYTMFVTANRSSAYQYGYRLCFTTEHAVPGGGWALEEGQPGGPTVQGSICTNDLAVGTSTLAFQPYQTNTVLQDGHSYKFCAWAYIYSGGVFWQTEAQAGGQYSACATTTIDRSKPAISVHLAGDAVVTNTRTVPVRIDYQDSISPPWPGPNGSASNFVCAAPYPTQCSPNQVSPDCSVPATPNSRVTSFNCVLNTSADGRYTVCAIAADSGIPDHPNAPWDGTANSTSANLSNPMCATVTVDTVAPTVTPTANAVKVTVGQLVTFGVTASDPSGTTGAYTWDFGDNTAQGSGSAPTHTYTQAGTYVARATTKDGAGNTGSGTVTITVSGTPGGTNPGGTGPGGGTTPPAGGGAALPGTGAPTVTPPGSPPLTTTQVRATGAALAVAPVSAASLAKAAGGGGTRVTTLGALRLTSPKLFTSGRVRLPLTATLRKPGTITVTLLKGRTRKATGTVIATKAGTVGVALKVSRTLAPGAYVLKVAYRPKGGVLVTRQLALTVRRAPAKKKTTKSADAWEAIALR